MNVQPLRSENVEPGSPQVEKRRFEQPAEFRKRDIDKKNWIAHASSLALIVLAVIASFVALFYARLPLIVLLLSAMLTYAVAPIAERLERFRLPRPAAAGIVVVLLMAAMWGIGQLSYYQATEFSRELPRHSAELEKLVGGFRRQARDIEKTTEKVLSPERKEQGTITTKEESSWADRLNLGSVYKVVFAASFIPFLVYFMLTWQDHVRATTVRLFPKEHREAANSTLGMISLMIRQFIVGNIIIGVFIGGISTIVFGVLGVPYFYFIGFASGFLSLVPYLGVLLAALPPLVASIGDVPVANFAIIIIAVFGIHLFALNVLYPKLLGNRVQLNPLTVTIALLFWGWLWGAMGLILAIPLTAAMKIVFDHADRLRNYGAWLGE